MIGETIKAVLEVAPKQRNDWPWIGVKTEQHAYMIFPGSIGLREIQSQSRVLPVRCVGVRVREIRADFDSDPCSAATVILLEDGNALVAYFAYSLEPDGPRLSGPAVRCYSSDELREWWSEYREMHFITEDQLTKACT